ncbi:MAG: hypothetical protein KJ950_03550 [Proteobacteria bacterium]|nr:hypothetical protein [Pseudomonadota bacterium]MBU1686394.1 hypothetical protein [Pseudomonadota bacterium]
MPIKTEDEARQIIKGWLDAPVPAQERSLRQAIEETELAQMYYEQKGNDNGVARCGRIIDLLNDRRKNLES